jgi:hypothetical protein
MGDIRNAYKFLSESLNGRDHMKDLGLGGRKILKWILKLQGDSMCIAQGIFRVLKLKIFLKLLYI